MYDQLPTGLTFLESIGCHEDPTASPICTIGTLLAGQEKSLSIRVELDSDYSGTQLVNEASVSATAGEAHPSDNTDIELTTVLDPVEVIFIDGFEEG